MPLGDVHFGNPLFSYRHFKRTIDLIASQPFIYTVLMGDLCDTIIRTSPGDVYKQIHTPQEQRDWVIKELMPIKDKILGMVNGNHERRIYNLTGIDISQDIAKALNVPYRDEGMIVRVHFSEGLHRNSKQQYCYDGYITHGYGGARTDGAKVMKIERTASYVMADFVVMAHDHTVNANPTTCLVPNQLVTLNKATGFLEGNVAAEPRMLVRTNSYMKWGGYSEQNGFPPTNLIAPIIKLAGVGQKQIRAEVSSG